MVATVREKVPSHEAPNPLVAVNIDKGVARMPRDRVGRYRWVGFLGFQPERGGEFEHHRVGEGGLPL